MNATFALLHRAASPALGRWLQKHRVVVASVLDAAYEPQNPIPATLAKYGASLTAEGFLQRNGKVLGVRFVLKRGRLRIEQGDRLLASGPPTADFVSSFVEKFYYWEPINELELLSDRNLLLRAQDGLPKAEAELRRRVALYRRVFTGMSNADFSDWYRLRFLKRQPWPTTRPGDDPDVLTRAWATEAAHRGAPVGIGESVTYLPAAEALVPAVPKQPRVSEKLGQVVSRVVEIRRWVDSLGAAARRRVGDILTLPTDDEMNGWIYRTNSDLDDLLQTIEAEYEEARDVVG